MTLKSAIKKIVKNFDDLKDESVRYSRPQMEAVWCAYSDIAGSYEVDEEYIGVTRDGKIAWAYASGCSCWSGDFAEERFESLKEVVLSHQHLPEEWEKAIIKFAETFNIQSL